MYKAISYDSNSTAEQWYYMAYFTTGHNSAFHDH